MPASRFWFVAAFLLPTALAVSAPVQAQDESFYNAVAGKWLFGSEPTGNGCVVTLSAEKTIGGRSLLGADKCAGPVGVLKDALAWDFADKGIVFRDPLRKKLLELTEDEDATYIQPGKSQGQRLVLVPANEGQERLINDKTLAGAWQLRRPGGAVICSLVISSQKAPKSDEFYALSIDPGCDPGLQKLKLVKWHVEAALLVMLGSETASLSLVPKADGRFVKAAKEGGKPLEMVRK